MGRPLGFGPPGLPWFPPPPEDRYSDEHDEWRDQVLKTAKKLFGGNPRIFISPHPYRGFHAISPDKQPSGPKPTGLWYACGLEWIEWVVSEMPQWISQYVYAVEPDFSRMLVVKSETSLDAFARAFGKKGPLASGWEVDWPAVARRYDGIEICPYFWDRRYTYTWYSTWDVASGCIWRPRAVRQVFPLTHARRNG